MAAVPPTRDPLELSFIIISHRRQAELLRCLSSLDDGAPDAEIFVGLNGREPGNPGLMARLAALHPRVRVLEMEETARGEARNRLVRLSRGRILFFLDDDTVVPTGFAGRVLRKFREYPGVWAAGGANLGPEQAAPLQRAVDFLLRSPLGAGPMRVRYLPAAQDRMLPHWCFTLSNLGARREVFDRQGICFPDHCVNAEENHFLFRVERAGGAILGSPDLQVAHLRRAAPAAFFRQAFLSGRGRMQITRRTPATLQPAVLAPALFAAYLLALPALGRSFWSFLPAALYAAAALWEALRLGWGERDWQAAWRLPALLLLGHLGYAAGLLRGLLEQPRPEDAPAPGAFALSR